MSSVLIIEDEAIASQNLQRLIGELDPAMHVMGILQSVEEAVDWFRSQEIPDVVFLDIHLADGLAFAIFEQVQVPCPIIFTTAYDQYALQAFKVSAVDYLLKPIAKEDLARAMTKLRNMQPSAYDPKQLTALAELMRPVGTYKSYFLIPIRDKLQPLATADIAYFYLENKLTCAYTYSGQSFSIDKPLDTVMQQLNPTAFFRVNRQFIVAHKAIRDIHYWIGNKLNITLSIPTTERIIISRAKVTEFKEWFTSN